MAELVFSMIANVEITPAFGTMFLCVLVATALFIFGTKRYVIRKRDLKDNIVTVRALMESLFCWKKDNTNDRVIACPPGFDKLKESKGGRIKDDLVTAAYRMLLIFPVAGIFIPVDVIMNQYSFLLIPMSYSMHHPKMWTGTNMVGLFTTFVMVVHVHYFIHRYDFSISILREPYLFPLCRSFPTLQVPHSLGFLPSSAFIHTLNRETSTSPRAAR